jgi:hypothetical protein
MNGTVKSPYTTQWIIENAVNIMQGYPEGMTVRQLHYRLVSIGMTNDEKHYKKVCVATKQARWDGLLSMDDFVDREREMCGSTQATVKPLDEQVVQAKDQIEMWMTNYDLQWWSNQDNYVELWVEKKALQGVFEPVCTKYRVGLGACKGFPSLTFLNEATARFESQNDKHCVILYFGDYDPSGKCIPERIQATLERFGVDVDVERIALNPDQIERLHLVGAPPKVKDTRTKNWKGGLTVELDAIDPKTLKTMCEQSINQYFDQDLHRELLEQEETEKVEYQKQLKKFVKDL